MSRIKYRNIVSGVKKIIRFGLFIPLSNLVLVYGKRFVPTAVIDWLVNRRNKHIETEIEKICGTQYCLPPREPGGDKIWFLWLQGENNMPLIPRLCLSSLRKNANGHEVVVLSMDNIEEYLVLPERIKSLYANGNITAAHLSDIIRVGLWAAHGGFWIDSTMFLTSPIDENIFSTKAFSMKSAPEGFYVSECRWAGFCFYMNRAAVLPHMLRSMLYKYWETEDILIDYFMLDYLIDISIKISEEARSEIESIPFNNPALHALCPLLPCKFSQAEFNRITETTSFFKLSWKEFSDSMLLDCKDNFYHYLLKYSR